MSKALKNLMEQPCYDKKTAANSKKDATLASILSCLKRESPNERVSVESRKKNLGNCLTPINRSRKNTPFEEKKRSFSPKTPYLSIREYLEGRNKTPNARNLMETPGKNRANSRNREKNAEKNLFEITEKKEKTKKNEEELKITIKDENFQDKKGEKRKKHEFLVNVNINIENKINSLGEKSEKGVKNDKNIEKNEKTNKVHKKT